MDPVTHGAAGAFAAWSLPRGWAPPKSTAVAVASALLPDVDLFIEPYLAPGSAFEHRAFTHSLFGVAVLAPLVALVPMCLSKERKTYARYVVAAALGMLTHVILDLPTEIGAKVFYPFYRKTVFVDWLGHMDFTFFILVAFVLISAWTYARRDGALRRGILFSFLLAGVCWWIFAEWPLFALRHEQEWGSFERSAAESYHTIYPLVFGAILLALLAAFARKGWGFRQDRTTYGRMGLATMGAYLLVCGGAKLIALGRMKEFTEGRGIAVLARATARAEGFSFVAPLLWTGLVLAPEGVYEAEIRPFSRKRPALRLYPNTPENPFIAKSRTNADVRDFLSAARFPVDCYQVEGSQRLVEFYDHAGGGGVVRATLNDQLEVLSVRWVPIKEYTSNGIPSQAKPDDQVGNAAAPMASMTPCFVGAGAPIRDFDSKQKDSVIQSSSR